MENAYENSIPWLDDEFTKGTTITPEFIAEESTIGSLAVIIISAVVSITLLFLIAVFIDCRHQKLNKEKSPSKLFKLRLPNFSKSSANDVEAIAEKMEAQEPTPAPSTVIV